MPIDISTAETISCDNPNHSTNYPNGLPDTLAATDRTGWLFVTSEVYGQSTQSHVFCSAKCAADYANGVANGTIKVGA